MQEIFWFFLGAFFYLILDKINSFYKKVKFVNEVKIYAFMLIGFAYEHLVFAMTAKYISLEDSKTDEEKVKLYKNIDEAAFLAWKREAAAGLKNALPPIYKDTLEFENWDDIMTKLDAHHKKTLRGRKKG
jgi:hypothetical protein